MRCHAGSARLPPPPAGRFFGQPEQLSGGASSWHRHCAIPQAAFEDQPAARVVPGHAGVDDGRSFAHDPGMVATAQGVPVRRCGVSQVPFVDLVDETFLVRAPSGRAKPLDVIFVARRRLRAVPDPPCLRVGPEMRAWIVRRIVGGHFFGPVLRCVDMAAGAGARYFAPLQPEIPDLTAAQARRSSWIAKTATGRRIGHSCKKIETATQHEIKPQLRAHEPASGCHCPISRQLQRTMTLRPGPGTPQPAACMSANTTASPLVRQSWLDRHLC